MDSKKSCAPPSLLIKSIDILLTSNLLKSYKEIINILQLLITEECFLIEEKLKLISYLPPIIDSLTNEKDIIQVLQIFFIVINKETITQPGLCSMIMNVFNENMFNKSPLICLTVISIVKQMNILLFSLLTIEDTELKNTEIFNICEKQLAYFIKSASEKTTPLLLLIVSLDAIFVLLHEAGNVILKSKSFVNMFTKSLLPALQSYLKNLTTPFCLLYRVMRLGAKLMVYSSKFFFLLYPIMSRLDSEPSCYLVLESFSIILSVTSNVAVAFSRANDSRLINEILIELGKIAKKLTSKTNVTERKKIIIIRSMKNVMKTDDVNVTELPSINHYSFISLITEILIQIIQGMEELFLQEKIQSGEVYEGAFTQRQIENLIASLKENCDRMYELFITLLKESQDENNIQRILKGIKSLISMTGSTKLKVQMHSMLKHLCQLSLPLKLGNSHNHP